jgi:hypothetical protein
MKKVCTKCGKSYRTSYQEPICPHSDLNKSKEQRDEETYLNNIHANLFGGINEPIDGQEGQSGN